MKIEKNLVVLVAILIGGCANDATKKETKISNESAQISQNKNLEIPAWFATPPAQTDEEVNVAGYGESRDLSLALQKAMADADMKLSLMMEAKFQSLRKSYAKDTGAQVNKSFEVTTKTVTDTTIYGHKQKTSKIHKSGDSYQIFVLMTYPLGAANKFAQEALGKKLQNLDQTGEADASKELTSTTGNSAGNLKLLDVDSDEYKKRRDATLQKSGAVIGNAVVR
jgi:hypothetical protein